MKKTAWHSLPLNDTLDLLKADEKGLSQDEAEKRLDKYGLNELRERKKINPFQIFLNQFKSFLIFVLIVAVVISFGVGEVLDATMILIIIFINAILGFVQEYKANKAIEALKRMTTPHAVVVRDGLQKEIPSKELVPGDVIVIEEGKRIPADSRIIKCDDLFVDESALTGESVPVPKSEEVVKKDTPVAERENMIFMGTYATRGYARAVVTDTGSGTEFGKIAEIVQKTEKERSPLKEKLEKMAKNLTVLTLIFSFLIFIIGIYTQNSTVLELFLVAVTLAVAAIPEALPAVITLTLAIGMQNMAKNNAIVKKLLAVETLGTTSVICSDKTGTLTRNEMTVTKVFVDDRFVEVTGKGYKPEGNFLVGENKIDPLKQKDLNLLLKIGALCNNASLIYEKDSWRIIGDPTEGSLIVLARKSDAEFDRENIISEIPFSSKRKMMSVIYSKGKINYSYAKGAPEKILEKCSYVLEDGKKLKLTEKRKEKLLDISREMAGEPLRVLGLAYKKLSSKKEYYKKDAEENLVFVGLVGMVDPPRMEVKEAIRQAHNAGIRTVMITGDHKVTALAISKKIGIMKKQGIAVTGKELDSMGEKELESIVNDVSVYARVSPEHKVRILEALRKNEHVVAMTGDGVNDAPAIKKADIGVSMGIKGTDVTKEASDMVLQDDNYATIVKAIEGGRAIYDNIRKFVKFMLSMNFTELFLVVFASIARLPLPLLPLQILWINLATDSLPALALAVDNPDPNIMNRPPRKKKEGIFSGGIFYFIVSAAVIATSVWTLMFFFSLDIGLKYARTMVFTIAVMFQMVFVFNCRSETKSVFLKNPFSNLKLVGAVIATFCLQLMVIYVPMFQKIFETVPLALNDWLIIGVLSLIGLIVSPLFFKKKKRTT